MFSGPSDHFSESRVFRVPLSLAHVSGAKKKKATA